WKGVAHGPSPPQKSCSERAVLGRVRMATVPPGSWSFTHTCSRGVPPGRSSSERSLGNTTSSSVTGVPAGMMPWLLPGQVGRCSSSGPPNRKVVAGAASRCARTQDTAIHRGPLLRASIPIASRASTLSELRGAAQPARSSRAETSARTWKLILAAGRSRLRAAIARAASTSGAARGAGAARARRPARGSTTRRCRARAGARAVTLGLALRLRLRRLGLFLLARAVEVGVPAAALEHEAGAAHLAGQALLRAAVGADVGSGVIHLLEGVGQLVALAAEVFVDRHGSGWGSRVARLGAESQAGEASGQQLRGNPELPGQVRDALGVGRIGAGQLGGEVSPQALVEGTLQPQVLEVLAAAEEVEAHGPVRRSERLAAETLPGPLDLRVESEAFHHRPQLGGTHPQDPGHAPQSAAVLVEGAENELPLAGLRIVQQPLPGEPLLHLVGLAIAAAPPERAPVQSAGEGDVRSVLQEQGLEDVAAHGSSEGLQRGTLHRQLGVSAARGGWRGGGGCAAPRCDPLGHGRAGLGGPSLPLAGDGGRGRLGDG